MKRKSDAGNDAEQWELWNLRALFPGADREDLARVRRGRHRVARWEGHALNRLVSDAEALFKPGRDFLAANSDISSGLIVTMHLGPYQFLPEPFLHTGIRPAVLLESPAFHELKVRAERLQQLLNMAGQLEWLPIANRTFVRKMITVLRENRPLLVFLDGNSGLGGNKRTREAGMIFPLPGREIRIRTGLGRLIRKLGCPVHGVVLKWLPDGTFTWNRAAPWSWTSQSQPEEITRQLYEWGFAQVIKSPEQWGHWKMLMNSYACFSSGFLGGGILPRALHEDFHQALNTCLERSPGTVGIELTKAAEVWPGDVLANLSDDRFYSAEGLQEDDLRYLRRGQASFQDLINLRGGEWVRFHILRLCLLDMAQLKGI